MRLTDARQLDALPKGAEVLVRGRGCLEKSRSSAWHPRGDQWGEYPGHNPLALYPDEEVYLLEATARTPEDLDRLLPGAVLEDGYCKWSSSPTISASSQWVFPLEILHPGNPIDTEEVA